MPTEKKVKKITSFSDIMGQNIEVYSYDDEGNMIASVYTNTYGKKTRSSYFHDSRGNLVREVHENSDGEMSSNDYQYDGHNNMTKRTWKTSSGGTWTWVYRYDSQGNLAHDEQTTPYSCEINDYVYDENGNMIKKLTKNEYSSFSSITITEITYQKVEIPFQLSDSVTDVFNSALMDPTFGISW